MSWWKTLLAAATECGEKGMSSGETYKYLKEKYEYADFSGEDFNFSSPCYLAWEEGHIEFIEKSLTNGELHCNIE